ncbi:non-ribosomal peptide synthase/polyketide synthase [Paenibacillus elgii]|uniref:non-ribosomal peptide synthase/polyketide synthase n=1 Tax=Paenibacillus elgii TaxID=189691 RepID=UPI002D7DFD90|nr:non-ribosomal peptide synthase/polyketide synthase [Paenibacillus elgii]
MDFEKESLFWNAKFSGEDDTFAKLPYTKTPTLSASKACSAGGMLSAHVARRVIQMSKGSPLAAFTILLAGVQCLLYKYTNEPNLLLGMPIVKSTDESRRPVNHVVLLRNTLGAESTFRSLITELTSSLSEVIRHQNIPFRLMTERLQLQYADGVPVINTLVTLNGLHMEDIGQSVVADCVFQFGLDNDSVRCELNYNENLYHEEFMARAITHLDQLLSVVLFQPELAIRHADMLTEPEKRQLLQTFNDTETDYERGKTIHRLIEEQAERTPDHVAVVFENERLTYRELNERANRLARTLRAGGVGRDKLVGLMVGRSLEMIVGILGILKAGGAYVPIDPEYPEERIRYMLEDSEAQLLLTRRRLLERVPFAGNVIALDDEEAYSEDGSNPEHAVGPNDLAYVIYTSGTTGKPKGVLVEHHGLCSLKTVFAETLRMNDQDRVVQFASLSFDASCWEMVKALFFGAALYIPTAETILDHRLFESFINDHGITTAILPPTYATYLNPNRIPSLKKLITGGSAASLELVQQWKDKVNYFNAYGPTEDSICTTIWTPANNDINQLVPIGRPIRNHRIYIIDSHRALLPVAVAGELCIAGVGLTRGYLNRPGLTAEKFVDNPFSPGERMYRTGDLARWLPDGNIEYMGRIDHQVKIRGYRIETGEIEEQFLKIASVQEAIVIAREDASGQNQLCAYFVADQSLTAGELREALSKELPGYMLPSHFVQLSQMPLTPNGKIDRKALPAPEGHGLAGREYVAPRNEAEKALADVWQAVLGVERVGVTDPFFELGGDSIKSIQVSARLHQAGYKLEIRNLFKYPTIAQLGPHIQPLTRTVNQGEVTGEVELTPIQCWFFEQQWVDLHHFNQAVMLYRKERFDEAAVHMVLRKITEHHDALRMVFRKTENGYTAWNRGIAEGEPYGLEVIDFKNLAACAQAVEAKANEIQSSINLETGPLVRAGLFQCPDGDHLLIAIHHGVVDGVSWRILMEDIALGFEQIAKGEELRFPAKTDAYRTWSEQLIAYAQSPAMEKERAYWQQVAQTPLPLLPKDRRALDESLQRDSESMVIQISQAETEQLLKRVHRAYNTEMNDILLTALGLAVQKWSGHDRVPVSLEGHGRESILPDIDITRTVGWFTSKFPVVLELERGKALSHQIKTVKEHLRQVPNKGIGYGVCRYLSGHADDSGWGAEPEIVFNYLGQFDQNLEHHEMGLSPYSSGMAASERQARSCSLEINGMILNGSLSFDLSYSRKEYNKETMEQLAMGLQESLQDIIAHCTAKERMELTPSDVQYKGLSVSELEQLAEHTRHIGEMENIYALTPMQKGMWFHSAMDRKTGAYFEQARFNLFGKLDVELFAQSWAELAARHVVLRTNFHSWKGELLQIVYRDKPIEFAYEDLRHLPEAERTAYTEKMAKEDKLRGFDLERDALVRVIVMRTEKEKYHVLWSFQHILMDGWCLPQLTQELFDTYAVYVRNEQPEQTAVPAYGQYIEWLENQDEKAAAAYWSRYLAGYEGQIVLPQRKTDAPSGEYVPEEIVCELGRALSERMDQVAKQHQVTMNTLLQAAWGIMLQKYNGTGDAVFGSVVSGRPAEIPGIERMIGLFINTIPIRVACEADASFADVMGRLQEQALESGRYDYYPLYEIQARSEQKQNLINHIIVFENYPMDEQIEQAGGGSSDGLAITDVDMAEQTNYDFNVTVIPGETMKIHLGYNAHVFDRESIERLRGHLVHVLEQIVANPRIAVKDLELTTADEKAEILKRFNDTTTEFPREKTLHQLVEEQAERIPEAVAVVFENEQWTYRELNERANRLARTLQAHGADKDRVVGMMTERSLEMIVGILAILKSGAAYAPIDPEYPEERIRYMIEDSGACALLTQRHLHERVPVREGLAVLDLDDEQVYHTDGSNLERSSGAADLACVIYTSGTTGKPKGNLAAHRNIVRIVRNTNYIDITEQDRVLQLSSYSFDGSIFDIFGALTNGARLVLIPRETMLEIAKLAELIEGQQISVMLITTAFFNVLVDVNVNCMRYMRAILFGGERVSVSHVRRALQHIGPGKLIHAYGPSESTVYATYYVIDELKPGAVNVPIGRPISNTAIYIVDGNDKLQPVGVAGELCIGGEGLVRGYLNRPELTAEKFVDNPFAAGERMYRTGDLARWLPDGTIEYVGRIDDQVKIRGFRIELGEIESHLSKIESLQTATVVVWETANGEKQLCAYYVADSELQPGDLKSVLARELPAYMIPSYFMQMERLPLTPNGKVDRRALPAPEESLHTEMEYTAPRTPLEAKLAAIWQEVLGLEKVGVKDNFFELGGHSLRATTLVSKLHKELNVQFPLRDVFRYTTIEEMAQAVAMMEERSFTAIPAAEERAYYPLSSAQKRLYILHQLEGAEQSYNMPGAVLLEGALDRKRLEEAFRGLIARHETLRTAFEMVSGEAVQRIYPEVDFAVEYVRASEEEAAEIVRHFARTFDLAKPPLLRVGMVELAEERHILMFDMHHIISDGVSMDVLVEEFVRLYDGEELKPLRIQYKDYAVWQQSETQKERMKRQEAYWLDVYQGEQPVLEMPTDYARPAMQRYEGHTLQFFMNAQKSEGLKRLAAESGSTLYMVLLAAYTVLLHKYTGQQDVIVGTPIAGRTHGDLQPIIGMFVNTLAIRNSPTGEKTFLTYLEEVKEATLNAYEHQDYPFEELVEKVQVVRDLSRNPLFDTMFTLQNTEGKEFQLEGLQLTSYPSDYGMSKFDLSLDVTENNGSLEYTLEYATALYKQETIERLAKHFEQLVEAIVSHPEAKIAELDMLTAEEKEQLQRVFNPAIPEQPPEKTFHRLFEEQALRTPEAAAVRYEDKQLTYRELNDRANRLASTLRSAGIGRESIVGILADRSVDLLVGVIGVWKAGGAYVPLDPDYPSDRIGFMLEDSGASVLLTQTHLRARVQAWLEEGQALHTVLCLDDERSYVENAANVHDTSEPHDLAYVIYTSGTTGRPKGVMIEHRSLVNTAAAYRREYRLDQSPVRLLQLASFSFDVFVGDIARTLYNGGTMVICPKDDRIDPARLYSWIRDGQITIFESTPALIVPFMDYVAEQGLDMSSMRLLITSSDSCSVADYRLLQERYGSQFRIINAYGVTEAAIDSSFYDEPLEKLPVTGNVPIGKAWLNARFYIVDAQLKPVPIGILGELCIGGVGVARGYLNRTELTEEKFVDSPFVPGERLYRTGDLARWMADGNVDFIGRIDHQAKIRGYRIEIGEVESQLLKVKGVREAVVVVREDGNGQKSLCAYFTADGEHQANGLRSALSQELPGYMIPSYFVQMERLPLTPNGKIDRKALPAPEGNANGGSEFTAPRTPLEAKLVRIWQEVLGLEKVGVKDNFFDLGGHSLRATTLAGKVHKEMNVELPLRDVFRYTTVEEMAQAISRMGEHRFVSIPKIEEKEYYPLSSAQKRLYILHQLEGAEQSYNMPGAMLLEGALDRERIEEAFRRLVERHETLRTGFEMVNGEPMQRVSREADFTVEYVQASDREAAEVVREFVRAFDLAKPPLLRVGLAELAEQRHILMFDMHHIISDGISMDILVEEFVRLYGGEELEPLRIQYKDYAAWQQSEAQQELIKRQEAYWLDRFRGELPVLEMPTDFPRPAVRKFDGNLLQHQLDPKLGEGLQRIAAESGATLFMVLLAAYTVLLQKYTGQQDIVVGTPIAGRTHGDLQPLIGMFVNTLAIRSCPDGKKTFRSFLAEVKETMLEAYEHQNYPFEELVEKSQAARDLSRNPLFDTLFALPDQEMEELQFEGLRMSPYPDEHTIAKFDLSMNVTEGSGGLEVSLEYATSLYKRETVERMAKHFGQLLAAIVQAPEAPLASLDIMTAEEKERIQHVFNATAAAYPSEKTIHRLFEEQAERTPDHPAVVFEGRQLTYRELNERANRLARTLREAEVKPDQTIGLMAERSLDMIVGMIAVLKAGGAYVPIDPDYPEERIRFMLEDSGAELLLVQTHLRDRAPFAGKLVELDDERSYSEDGSALEEVAGPNDLAYVIYTSGTTGKPKGVMVEHRNVVRLVKNTNYVELNEQTRILQTGAVVFDASTFEIWGVLLNGGRLCVVPSETILDASSLKHAIERYDINTMWLTSPLFNQLSQQDSGMFAGLKTLIVGGDVLSVPHINRVQREHPELRIINGYGPTENTTFSTTYAIVGEQQEAVPIGKPISNSTAHIVDSALNLLPVGVWGELLVGGDGIARGYLNQPELTAEKFVERPFCPGRRCYRTGDLARWLPDGTLEYKGRMDEQVKIRGYRIELGEIEEQLLKLSSVQEATVIAREDESGHKQLCAYFVTNLELSASELRAALSQKLPNYMIPSHFVPLQRMPLTPNGKIDRKALPAPEGGMLTKAEYIAPRTEQEQALAAVWQAVLGVERVGASDHFFELGGDSIKSIQVSSRLHQAGYKLEIRDLFKYPTIAQLSPHIREAGRRADQGEVTGEAGLTPIQRWFFGQQWDDLHHFNQSVMLYRKEGFDEAAIRQVLQKITEHHDALRIVFRRSDNGYTAWNRAIGEGETYSLEVADFRGIQAPDQAVEAKSNEIQSGIDLEAGPLVKAGLFHCSDGDHLLIVIHHAVVDGVSWRIILEDIALGYEQAAKGEAIRLPAKTDAFRSWSERLAAYAQSPAIENERAYWQRIAQTAVSRLPKDKQAASSLERDSETIVVQWNRGETELLLKGAHRAYNTEINDILLTALGMALQKWCGHDRLLVNMEGHGREPIMEDIDITRTVGWFTSKYPVVLELEPGKNLSYHIKKVKESLRQIPKKGIGYGICRYMCENPDDTLWSPEPEISFNYLGQFDQDLQNSDVGISAYSGGKSSSDKQTRSFALDINGMISDGVLSLELSYSRKEYRRETIGKLAACLQDSLREIVAHCTSKVRTELTPSDVQFKGLSIAELEQIEERTRHIGEIENIYTLTPMQKGMWFHNTLNRHGGAYVEQAMLALQGDLNMELFARSWNDLTSRHVVLRTNFYNGWKGDLLQIVYRDKPIEFTYEDLSRLEDQERKACIDKLKNDDKVRGFDLEQDALMRVKVIRTQEQSHLVLWTFHHILLDGWCLALIANEIFDTHAAYVRNERPAWPDAPAYGQFIEWLERQDKEAASRYWSGYLAEYEGQTMLPQGKQHQRSEVYEGDHIVRHLGKSLSGRMSQVANQFQVTVNTLIQAAWGVILQKYNGTGDVVFGSVVSGRPAEIPGIEDMIGLFINTIPVRVTCEVDTSFADVMKRLQESALESGRYDYYPLYDIQAQTAQKQDLINHIMAFENYPLGEQIEQAGEGDDGKLKVTDVDIEEQTSYDFTLTVMPVDELVIRFDFNTLVYERSVMERLMGHFIHVLEQVSADPQAPVGALELITAAEKTEILDTFNNTATEYPRDQTIHGMFEEQAWRNPDAVAVVFETARLTYGELNEKANRLARTLRDAGVQTDQLVGLMAERSLEMIVGVLAIMKAGGAYIPIDPQYPEERIRYMLEDSGAQVLVGQRHLRQRVSFEGKFLAVDEEQSYSKDGSNLEPVSGPNDLAYVIYTSGTTGKPKGVMVEHRGLCSLKLMFADTLHMTKEDRIVQFASLSFDASCWEILKALCFGSALYIPTKETIQDYRVFEKFMNDNEITAAILPPTYAASLNLDRMTSLKKLITGGSAVTVESVKQWKGKVSYFNAYGPTEASIVTSIWAASTNDLDRKLVPIGKPIQNHRIYIVDSYHRLQPIGVAGELCIAGVGLARGYLNRPELTAEKFVNYPFTPGERLYRTGDLARWLPDGNIEYVGRIDHQVKIRGYRIELGEVEAQLAKVASVQEAIVIAFADASGLEQLCAYYVAQTDISAAELKKTLSLELPDYMIPAYFVQLPQMPLTPNGKINRKALPAPEAGVHSEAEYVAPRTLLETKLVQIWQDVLGLKRIGVKDNFFELGGNSISLIRLIQRIHDETGVEIPLHKGYEYTSVEAMANANWESGFENNSNHFVKLNQQGELNVFCFPPGPGFGIVYQGLAERLDNRFVVYSIDFIDDSPSYEDMIDCYVDEVLRVQKQEPYVFMGYCIGGNMMFEVAKAMEKRGYPVSDLIMVDSLKKHAPKPADTAESNIEETIKYLMATEKELMDNPAIRERIALKVRSTLTYEAQLVNTGTVLATVHDLVAEDTEAIRLEQGVSWNSAARQDYAQYKLAGDHDQLLEPEYIDSTTKLILRILDQIAERIKQSQEVLHGN